jgi:hypothetical protein
MLKNHNASYGPGNTVITDFSVASLTCPFTTAAFFLLSEPSDIKLSLFQQFYKGLNQQIKNYQRPYT